MKTNTFIQNNTIKQDETELYKVEAVPKETDLKSAVNYYIDALNACVCAVYKQFKDKLQNEYSKAEILETALKVYDASNLQILKKCYNKEFLYLYIAIKITQDFEKLDNGQLNDIHAYIRDITTRCIASITLYCLIHETKPGVKYAVVTDKKTGREALERHILDGLNNLLIGVKAKACYLDIPSLIKYFAVITNYAVDLLNNRIFSIDLYKESVSGYIGLSKAEWKNLDLQTFLLDVIKFDKDGARYKVFKYRAQSLIFDSEFCTLYKSYKHGIKFSPYNPATPYRDTHIFFHGKDFYNKFVPAYKKIVPDTEFKHLPRLKWQFEMFLQVVRVCTNFNDDYSKFLLDYIAQLVQKPYQNMPYIIYLCSTARGIGKTNIIAGTIKRLVGFAYTVDITSNFDNVTGKYNAPLANTVFQLKDELDRFNNGKEELLSNLQDLKGLVTSQTHYVQDKHVKGREERIYFHPFITTNFAHFFHPEQDERRQVYIKGLDKESECKGFALITDAAEGLDTISFDNITEYRELLARYKDNLDSPDFEREFYQYCFNYFTQRKIDVDFASASKYFSFDFIRETNRQFEQQEIATKADVLMYAIKDMFNDLFVQDVCSLTGDLRKQYDAVLNAWNLKNFTNNSLKQHLERITTTHVAVGEFELLNLYIRNVLETNNNLYELEAFKTSYISRGRALPKLEVLGRYYKEFAEKYPQILSVQKQTRGTRQFYKYKLSSELENVLQE